MVLSGFEVALTAVLTFFKLAFFDLVVKPSEWGKVDCDRGFFSIKIVTRFDKIAKTFSKDKEHTRLTTGGVKSVARRVFSTWSTV